MRIVPHIELWVSVRWGQRGEESVDGVVLKNMLVEE